MIRRVFVLFLIMMQTTVFAQDSSFVKLLGTPQKDIGLNLSRSSDGGFLLEGTSFNVDTFGDAVFYKLDNIGTPIWGLNIGTGGVSDYPAFVIEKSNGNCLLGISSDATNLRFRLVTVNSSGIILSDTSYLIWDGFPDINVQCGYYINDNSFITLDISNNSILYARKWSSDGEIVDSLKILSSMDYGEIEVYLRSVYMIGANYCINAYIETSLPTNFLFILDDNLSIVDSSSFSTSLMPIYEVSPLNLKSFFLSAIGGGFMFFGRYSMDMDSLIWNDSYTISTYSISSQDQITNSTDVFVCGQSLYNGNDTTKAAVLKFDSLGVLIWHKQYNVSGYKNSILLDVKYYSDCIASIGYAYNPNDQDSYDILFIKSDHNGNITSITPLEKPDNTLTVFPNPVKDMLSVNLITTGKSNYTITDAAGRIVLTGNTENNQIQVSSLLAAYYLLQWENDGKIYKANFIKE